MSKAVAKPKAKKRKRQAKPKLTAAQKAEHKALEKAKRDAQKAREKVTLRKAKEKLLASTRTYCAACGGKLASNQSKKIALCRRCLSYCPRCGGKTNTVGHYDICQRCVSEVATLMQRYDAGHNPGTAEMPWDKEPVAPKEVSICGCCGDEGEFEYHGRMLCAMCRAEVVQEEDRRAGG